MQNEHKARISIIIAVMWIFLALMLDLNDIFLWLLTLKLLVVRTDFVWAKFSNLNKERHDRPSYRGCCNRIWAHIFRQHSKGRPP